MIVEMKGYSINIDLYPHIYNYYIETYSAYHQMHEPVSTSDEDEPSTSDEE